MKTNEEYYEEPWTGPCADCDGTGRTECDVCEGEGEVNGEVCQAYAKHVYNALVPPTTTPSDLGLRPWFGNWGKWAVDPYI